MAEEIGKRFLLKFTIYFSEKKRQMIWGGKLLKLSCDYSVWTNNRTYSNNTLFFVVFWFYISLLTSVVQDNCNGFSDVHKFDSKEILNEGFKCVKVRRGIAWLFITKALDSELSAKSFWVDGIKRQDTEVSKWPWWYSKVMYSNTKKRSVSEIQRERQEMRDRIIEEESVKLTSISQGVLHFLGSRSQTPMFWDTHNTRWSVSG